VEIILFDVVCRLGEFMKGLFDNLTKTDFRSMRIFLETKIHIIDNLTKHVFHFMRFFVRIGILICDNLGKTNFRFMRIFLRT
jgi:hypothetical protein